MISLNQKLGNWKIPPHWESFSPLHLEAWKTRGLSWLESTSLSSSMLAVQEESILCQWTWDGASQQSLLTVHKLSISAWKKLIDLIFLLASLDRWKHNIPLKWNCISNCKKCNLYFLWILFVCFCVKSNICHQMSQLFCNNLKHGKVVYYFLILFIVGLDNQSFEDMWSAVFILWVSRKSNSEHFRYKGCQCFVNTVKEDYEELLVSVLYLSCTNVMGSINISVDMWKGDIFPPHGTIIPVLRV